MAGICNEYIVFLKVGTALYVTHLYQICALIGCAMDQAVSWQPFITKARVRSPVSPREICGGQIGTVTGFLSQYFSCPSVSFHQCSILFIFWLLLSERQMGEAWEHSKQ